MSNINRFTIEWTKYFVLSFGLIIFFFMVISELFQIPDHPSAHLAKQESPIKKSILERISSLTISNNLGTYHLAKIGNSWRMIKPRNLQARNDLVEQIVQSLKNVNVRRLYEKDKINLQNFFLHQPTIEMELAAFGEGQKLKVGLLNTIDDSTYIIDDQSSLIYQIDLFKVAIQSLGLSDFINSNIFSESVGKVQQIKISRHQSNRSSTRLILMKKKNLWVNKKGREANQSQVQEFLSALLSKKAEVILDQKSRILETRIKRIMGRPLFTVSIQHGGSQKTTYQVSHPLNSLPDLKLEKKKFVLITSSKRGHPFLVDKSILELLDNRDRTLGKK